MLENRDRCRSTSPVGIAAATGVPPARAPASPDSAREPAADRADLRCSPMETPAWSGSGWSPNGAEIRTDEPIRGREYARRHDCAITWPAAARWRPGAAPDGAVGGPVLEGVSTALDAHVAGQRSPDAAQCRGCCA